MTAIQPHEELLAAGAWGQTFGVTDGWDSHIFFVVFLWLFRWGQMGLDGNHCVILSSNQAMIAHTDSTLYRSSLVVLIQLEVFYDNRFLEFFFHFQMIFVWFMTNPLGHLDFFGDSTCFILPIFTFCVNQNLELFIFDDVCGL